MDNIPIPQFYRVTNNLCIPKIHSLWVNELGITVKVTNLLTKKTPTIVCYKNIECDNTECSVSLHKFQCVFSLIDT